MDKKTLDKLTTEDHLRLQLANQEEVNARLGLENAQLRLGVLRLQLSGDYGLTARDSISFDTGALTRGADPAPLAV